MGGALDPREARLDLRLGKMAVRKGLITPAQLEEALKEPQLGVQRGRKKPRRLGIVLAARHLLTDDLVLSLLEEQEARLVAQDKQRAGDLLLGRILIDGGFSTLQEVKECLRLQEEAIQEGRDEIPLLGKVLIERGHATSKAVDEALELQKGIPLVCRRCGEQTMSGAMDLSAALADLDRSLLELDKARQEVDACRARPKPQTLDQEQHFADERREAEAKMPKAEERARAVREQVRRTMALGVR